MSRKRLINSVKGCVDDSLEGLVWANPGLRLLKGGHRVVIRADIDDVIAAGHVTILTGGGAGHEPGHSGYVGAGMATAVVTGPIFTSPPSQDVLAAIRAVGRGNSAGVLVTFNNYTGDRLTFGLAVERAKAEGIKVEVFINADDCAVESVDHTAGRRGITGGFLLIKIAGALAEEGKSLKEIMAVLKHVAKSMGSISLCLTPCSVPGSGPFFHLKDDEMALGLGLHGEAGVKTIKVTWAQQCVELMLGHMTNPTNEIRFSVKKGDRVVCMLNNLGSLTFMEMNILGRDLINYLEQRGAVVERFFSGHFVTSQEMTGVSITLLTVNDDLIKALDFPTTAPAWRKPCLSPSNVSSPSREMSRDVEEHVSGVSSDPRDTRVSNETGALMHRCLKACCERVIASEERLNRLDTECGDGDCGSTLRAGATAILDRLGPEQNPSLPVQYPSRLARCLAAIVEASMGGSSGGLYGIFFAAASEALQSPGRPEAWSQALQDGIGAIARHGRAGPGFRTMLDALYPTSSNFSSLLSRDLVPHVAFLSAMQAGKKAAESTAGMKARAGRASYVETSRLKEPDPGAIAVAIWMEAISDTMKQQHKSK